MAITWTPASVQPVFLHNGGNTPTVTATLVSIPQPTDIVLLFTSENNSSTPTNAVTVNSNAMTAFTPSNTVTNRLNAFWMLGSLLSSASLSITLNSFGGTDQGTVVGVVSGAINSPAPAWFGVFPNSADPQQFASPLTIPAGGLGVFSFTCNVNTHPSSINNFNQDFILDAGSVGGTDVILLGNQMSAGSWNPQVNGYSFGQVEMAGVIFTPSPTITASDGSGGGAIFRVRRPGWPRYASRRPIVPRPTLVGWRNRLVLPNRFQERAHARAR